MSGGPTRFARRALASLCLLGAACDGCSPARAPQRGPTEARSQPAAGPAPVSSPHAPADADASAGAAPPAGAVLRYLVVGGGAFPVSTEASLEHDAQLASEVLPGPGRILFAGGSSAQAVRSLDPALAGSSQLLPRLGDLFAPRNGRRSRYRRPQLSAGAATGEALRDLLSHALDAASGQPVLLYVASHGEQGQRPVDNWVSLWGGEAFGVDELVALHEAHPAPLRAVIASCYSGGFSEMAFAAADAARGVARAPRCGLFAGTWDRQTAGCDPDPDRRHHEGYSLHFLNALRRSDRGGRSLPLAELDLDGDGRVSLLEAHTRARVQSHSIDVPTTTSERFLREVQMRQGAPATALLPEEARVVDVLGRSLGLPDIAAARTRAEQLEVELDALDAAAAAAAAELDVAYGQLAALLLARWPLLDDPYHPGFAAMLQQSSAQIEMLLNDAPEALHYAQADRALKQADDRYWKLRADEAMVVRYVRAQETLALAGGLSRRGGADYAAYRSLLACERYVPGDPTAALVGEINPAPQGETTSAGAVGVVAAPGE